MDNLRISTLNARGLGNHVKRKRVYRYLKRFKSDVCFLQETHCDSKKEQVWSSEWGNKCIYSHGTTQARGVGILLNKKCAHAVDEIRRDIVGRYVMCKVLLNNYSYCLVNIYAPNEDSPEFFNEISRNIQEMDCVHVIIGGDFNLTLDPTMDRNVNANYNVNSSVALKKTIEDLDLIDPWHVRNQDSKTFTWMRGINRTEWSRIDYFLVSSSVNNNCSECDILPTVFSDHSMVRMSIDTSQQKQGPGTCKFNNELLNLG